MGFFTSKTLFRIGTAVLTVLCSSASALAGESYSVSLNKTEIVRLPENAGAVVIGNPEIADVTVHSANTLFVVGRGYGETNLLILNGAGHTIMNANIQVINEISRNGVRLYNGKIRETYSCSPYCVPSPVLGDSPLFIGANAGEAQVFDNNTATAFPTSVPSLGPSSSGSSSGLTGAPQGSSSSSSSFGSGTDF